MRGRHVDHVDRPTGIWIHHQHSPSMAGVPWYFGAAASRWSDGSLWVRESAQTTVEIGRKTSVAPNWCVSRVNMRELAAQAHHSAAFFSEWETARLARRVRREGKNWKRSLKILFLFSLLSLLLLISRIGKRSKKLHRVLRPRTGYLITMQYAIGTRPSDISSHLLLDVSPPTVLYGPMTKHQKLK